MSSQGMTETPPVRYILCGECAAVMVLKRISLGTKPGVKEAVYQCTKCKAVVRRKLPTQ
jgi:hypothetical protein